MNQPADNSLAAPQRGPSPAKVGGEMETRAPGTSRRLPPHRTCGPAAPPGPKMPQGNAHGEDSARFCPGSHRVGCQRFSKLGEIPTLPLCCLRERAERGGGGGRAAARSRRKLEDGNGSCWLFRATSSCKSLVWRCPRSLLSTHQEPKHLTPNPALSSRLQTQGDGIPRWINPRNSSG